MCYTCSLNHLPGFEQDTVVASEHGLLVAQGDKCDGETAEFIIYEKSGILRREIDRAEGLFVDGYASVEWKSRWMDGNPLPFIEDNPI